MSLKEVYQLSLAGGLLTTKLNPEHDLVVLAKTIDWEGFQDALRGKYCKVGRQAKHVRLMVGLHVLKHLYNLSDERVCQMLHENIYFRYFCGVHNDIKDWSEEQLLNPCTMSRFRQRLGADGMRLLEDVIKKQLKKDGRISGRTQTVDTTAMEKNIAYPTDTNLLAKGIERVKKAVVRLGKFGLAVAVRSYERVVRREILKVSKLGRGRKERVTEAANKLIGYAKKIGREAAISLGAIKKRASEAAKQAIEAGKDFLRKELEKLSRVVSQTERRMAGEAVPASKKVLSMHEANIAIIAKGKRRKRYEFGAKVSFSMDRNGYIVGHQEYQDNQADVNTLDPALEDWQRTFGDYPDELGADRGYTASNPSEALSRVRKVVIPKRGKKRHPDHNKAYFRRVLKTRNKIEPTIGHLKTDHRLDRCRYHGKAGDTLNVGFATIAWNFKKWFRDIRSEQVKMAA